jgi:hypothetical protein
MTVDPAVSNIPKSSTARDLVEGILRPFAAIAAAASKLKTFFLPGTDFASDVNFAESGTEQTGVVANATEKTVAKLTGEKSFTVPVAADAAVAPLALDQAEIQRRRNLVRMLFNDYWSGAHERPAAFKERLDQAEDYLNERLAAQGELWCLDAKTRAMLGLPPRSNSLGNEKNHAVRR